MVSVFIDTNKILLFPTVDSHAFTTAVNLKRMEMTKAKISNEMEFKLQNTLSLVCGGRVPTNPWKHLRAQY